MQKILAAAVILVVGVSVVTADEFFGAITKVDGNKLSITKMKKGEKGEELTLTASDNVKVVKGKFNKEDKKIDAGDAIEGGLKSERFAKRAMGAIITNADNVVIEIRLLEGFGKKKKDDNK